MEQNVEQNLNTEPTTDIFDSVKEEQAEKHRKVIKQARGMLFFIAALQIAYSLYMGFSKGGEEGTYELVTGGVVAALYIGLAFWAQKKPFVALITSLVLYILLNLANAILDPASLSGGTGMRIFIIIALANGIRKAKALQDMESIRTTE